MSKENENSAATGSGRKKRFGIGGVLDIVIILLIVAGLFSIGYRIYMSQNPTVSTDEGEYEVYFRVDSVSYMLPNHLQEGNEVYLSDSGKLLGKLMNESGYEGGSALNVTAATVTVLDDSGNYVSVKYPGENLVDATGAILAIGYVDTDGSFLLDGKTHITPGSVIRVRTESVDFTLTVTEIANH